jgi:hypothetical protein
VPLAEGELHFAFPDSTAVDRLDACGKPIPHGMSLVDFVVAEGRRTLLLEVKDPSQVVVPQAERERFVADLTGVGLINERLVPKFRDSYCYLHLMGHDAERRPCLAVLLLGLELCPCDQALLLGLKERLLGRLRREGAEPWVRQYATDCLVLSVQAWNTHFPQYPVTRVQGGP